MGKCCYLLCPVQYKKGCQISKRGRNEINEASTDTRLVAATLFKIKNKRPFRMDIVVSWPKKNDLTFINKLYKVFSMQKLVQKEIKRLTKLGASYVDIRVHLKDISETLSSSDGLLEHYQIEKRFGFDKYLKPKG